MNHEHDPQIHSQDEPLDQIEYANARLAGELLDARAEFRGLSDDSLRSLAGHALASASHTTSALRRLTEGETIELADLNPDGLSMASDPSTPPTVRNALDWIATTLLLREHPDVELPMVPISFAETAHVLVADQLQFAGETVVFRRRAGLPVFYRHLLEERLGKLLGVRGHALRAYLTLSDVDADDPDLIERMEGDYLGSYDDVVDAITTLTPYFQWDSDLSEWGRQRGLEGLIQIDHDGLTECAYDWWRVGDVKGRSYVFARS